MLRLALVQAGVDGVPDTPGKALLFVRAHLLAKLSADVGPRLAMAFMDELVEQLDEPPESGVVPLSPAPSSAPRIARLSVRSSGQPARGTLVIVDGDALRRASLARLLVPARWDVRTADSPEQLLDAASEGAHPGAVVVAVEHPSLHEILRAAVAIWPGAAIVLHGDLPRTAAAVLEWRQVRVCSRDEPLLERIDALVEELRQA